MKKKETSPVEEAGDVLPFENYNTLIVPLSPLRMEIIAYLKADITHMPLGEFLRLVAKVIKEDDNT